MVTINDLAAGLSEIGPSKIVSPLNPGRAPLAIAECEDCGNFLVTSAEFVSIFFIPEADYVMAITFCTYCERPVTDNDLSYHMAKRLVSQGVPAFNWLTGERHGG